MNIGQWYTYDGTPTSSTSTHKAGIDVMVVSQNEINNTSLVRVRPWIMKLSGTGFWNLTDQTMTIKANNVSRTTKTDYDFREATTDNKEYLTSSLPFRRVSGSGSLVSGTYVYDFTIEHEDNGSKTIPIYALIPLSSTYGTNWTVDENIELPTILRANTLNYSYTYLDENINFSIGKASTNFTSTINLSFTTENGLTLVGLGDIFSKTSATSLTYKLSEEDLNNVLSKNKTKNNVTAIITITTFNGNSQLGANLYYANISIKNTPPIVSATYIDTNSTTIALTGNGSKIIKYVSQPKVTITANPQQQSDIVSYSTIWGNSSSTTQETTFVNGIDSNILQVSAKDSRKWVGNISYDITENYIDYIKLGFEKFTLERPETTSNTINANLNGVWFNGNFGVSTNTLELKLRYKEKNGEYGEYQTISLTIDGNKFSFSGSIGDNYNYQKQYDFEFILSDKIMSLISTFNVTSGESIIRVGETYIRILGDLKVKGNVKINGNLGNITVESISSKNLFNKNDVVLDYYLSYDNGQPVHDTNMCYTNYYIDVKSGDKYTMSNTSATQFTIHYYDENKNWLGYNNQNNNLNSYTVTIIDNAKYVRLACGKIAKDSIQFEKGDKATEYTNYKSFGIIESGNNTNGNWVKFSDGTMICYKKIVGTVDINGSWGSLYQNNINLGSSSQTFLNVPVINYSMIGEYAFLGGTSVKPTNSNLGTIVIIRPTLLNNVPYEIDITAIGKWK